MNTVKIKSVEDSALETEYNYNAPCIGAISGVNDAGEVLVDFNQFQSVPAKFVSTLARVEFEHSIGSQVLIVFEKGKPTLPIIIDFVESKAEHILSFVEGDAIDTNFQQSLSVDGKRVNFSAQQEMVFRCGKSSITLRKDGKVVIRGTHLVSRSSGANKIKGGSVSIN